MVLMLAIDKSEMRPPRHARIDKFEMRAAMRVDIDLIAASRSTLARIPALGIAWINDHRRFRGEDRSRVHMAKSPVVESGRHQFVDRGGRVVGMTTLMADICVENRDRIRRAAPRLQGRRKIVRHSLARVADAGDLCSFAAAPDKRLSIGMAPKCHDIRRKLKTATPAVQRIVIAVHDEHGDAVFRKPRHFISKRNQRAEIPVLRVVNVSGNDQKIGFALNGVIDDAPQRAQSRKLQPFSLRRRR